MFGLMIHLVVDLECVMTIYIYIVVLMDCDQSFRNIGHHLCQFCLTLRNGVYKIVCASMVCTSLFDVISCNQAIKQSNW